MSLLSEKSKTEIEKALNVAIKTLQREMGFCNIEKLDVHFYLNLTTPSQDRMTFVVTKTEIVDGVVDSYGERT